jgi:hypothetical protein
MEAERMVNFVQSLTMEDRPARARGKQVNAVDEDSISNVETTCCTFCRYKGYTVEECRKKKSAEGPTDSAKKQKDTKKSQKAK